jgi:hypothetical protein
VLLLHELPFDHHFGRFEKLVHWQAGFDDHRFVQFADVDGTVGAETYKSCLFAESEDLLKAGIGVRHPDMMLLDSVEEIAQKLQEKTVVLFFSVVRDLVCEDRRYLLRVLL